jgi:hypothetical protein
MLKLTKRSTPTLGLLTSGGQVEDHVSTNSDAESRVKIV